MKGDLIKSDIAEGPSLRQIEIDKYLIIFGATLETSKKKIL